MCLKSKLTTATGAKTINPRNSDSYTWNWELQNIDKRA
jgi:hypothetical protein